MNDFASFLCRTTSIGSPILCPELRLHLASDLPTLWAEQERWLGRLGLPAPLWGVAWPGGQALARHILDNADAFRGASVLDMGSGSGLCAIAAAKAGGRRVEAADTDVFAAQAIEENARLNDVQLSIVIDNLIGQESRWDVVIAADLWYEKFLAGSVTAWLRVLARRGTRVLLGDSRRAYFPRSGTTEIARYPVLASPSLEGESVTFARVWTLGQ